MKMSNKDKIKEALSRIENGLAAINTDEDWLEYLKFQSLFYQYSWGNTMMIYLQNPEATFVAGYKTWNKLGRCVKKGSKGIAILCPNIRKEESFKEPKDKSEYHDEEGEKEILEVLKGFRVAYVFDIADTDGSDEAIPVLIKGLSGNSDGEKDIYERLYNVISKKFTIQEVSGTASKGSFNKETAIISIRADLDYVQKIKTLLHETAHGYDFEKNPNESIPRNRRELIAESVAYICCLRLGIDTSSYSISYLQSWLKQKDEIKIVAAEAQRISYLILNTLAEAKDSAFINLKEEQ